MTPFAVRDHGEGAPRDDLLIRSISARYMHKKEIEGYEKENPASGSSPKALPCWMRLDHTRTKQS